ncbi:MAG: hypothetical protein KGZ34_00345 [Nitrosarchaeum sp.]|nr:hypothetical protein [Nitrosarchaeum sp.]
MPTFSDFDANKRHEESLQNDKILKDGLAELLSKIQDLTDKLDKYETRNSEYLRKLLLMVSELFQQGKINIDTFNRLDEFLHDWLDESLDSK